MALLQANLCPRDIMTAAAFENAIAVDMALGGSTNTVLHLPAIANDAGVKLSLDTFDAISKRTPYLIKLSPAGPHHIQDLDEAGGVPAVMAELRGKNILHTDVPTVTGKTVGENLAKAGRRTDVLRPADNPYSAEAASPFCAAISPDSAVVSGGGRRRWRIIAARRASSMARKRRSTRSLTARSRPAMWSLSATKVHAVAQGCARC